MCLKRNGGTGLACGVEEGVGVGVLLKTLQAKANVRSCKPLR
jgi:hypothetical protein